MAKHGNITITDKDVVLEVVAYPSKKNEMRSFEWSEIVSIKVVSGTNTKMLFMKKPYEKILVQTTNPETPQYKMPIEIDKERTEGKFEEYVETFKKFSKQRAFKFEDKRK